MLPTSISEAAISSAVITVSTIFRALVTCSICCEACWRSKMLLMIGEIGCGLPSAPVAHRSLRRIPGRLAASSALTSKLAGSGLVCSCSTIDLSFSSLRSVFSASALLMKVTAATCGTASSFALRRGDFGRRRVVEEAELDVELAADLVALGLGRLEDRDQDAEQDHGHDRGHDRGQASGRRCGAARAGPPAGRRSRRDIRAASPGRGRWSGPRPRARPPSRPASAGRTRSSTPRCSRR